MGGKSSIEVADEKYIQTERKKKTLGDLGIDGKTIMKWILRSQV
jgi:hypothetical protein